MELKLNGTHRLLVYADDANLLGDVKKNTDGSKEVGLEIISSLECKTKS
jgi:hypothetical protein